MIVQCPECRTKYNLPDDKIPPDGAKVRCTKCEHVFKTEPPAGADEDLDDLMEEPSEEEESPAPDEEEADDFDDEDLEEETGGEGSMGLDIGAPSKKKKKGGGGGSGKKKLVMLLLLLVVVGGGAGAAWYLGLLSSIPYVGSMLGGGDNATMAEEGAMAEGETMAEGEAGAAAEEAVRKIVLENVRQYYVANEKAGQLFVIEGKAVNTFDSPRELIRIEATLFDAQGQALATKEVLCGNILSYFQLQILSREELETNLSSQQGVLENNTNLAPGEGAPFMVVFFEPAESVSEFGIKVVGSRVPEQ